MNNVIPPITDPIGSNWSQPEHEDVLIDDFYAVMTQETVESLKVYDWSIPSGVYEGKMFKQQGKLVWMSDYRDGTCALNYREILAV